ncbi:MAG: hypothetical protein LBQ59_01480 [Candidatus Peribacteria bacterium]|jgi:hypothetical protein|nr:hypothetical protein [Candidatus Peribacteria bacterium]
MLYTIKQLKRRINSYIFNSINDVDNVVRGINESPNTGEYLKQNAQAIRDYINSLDTRKRDGIIYMNELAKPENKKALENILKALRLDSDHLIKI